MRKLVIALNLLLVLTSATNSQVTIASEDFENTLTFFTSTGSVAPSFISGTTAPSNYPSGVPIAYLNAWAASKPHNIPGETVLESNTIDVGQYNNVQLSMRLQAISVLDFNSSQALDITDYVQVDISANGGTTWYPTVQVRGNNEATWTYSGGTAIASTPFDGNGVLVNFNPANGGLRTTDGYSTIVVTNLPVVPTLKVRVRMKSDLNEVWLIDDFKITGNVETSPAINVYPPALNTFVTSNGVPSNTQSYQVNGRNLTANLIISAPSGFELATNAAGPWDLGLSLNPVGGHVAWTNIYARVNTTTVGSNLQNITHSSTGVVTKNVSVTDTVYSTDPTVASTVSFTNVMAESMTIHFTGGNGTNRIVLMRGGSNVHTPPNDGVGYSGNSVFGSGQLLGPAYVVYSGNGSSVTVTNLTPNGTYYVNVYEYNDEASIAFRNYATTPGTGNATTTTLAQGLEMAAVNTVYRIDFDNTNPRTNNGLFGGVAANANPAVGELNSNAISVDQTLSNGSAVFGGSVTSGNGSSPGGVNTPGFYAFEHTPGDVGFGVKVSNAVWDPGRLTFRIENATGATVTKLNVGYNLYIRNDADSWTHIRNLHSFDNFNYAVTNVIHDTVTASADPSPVWKKYFRSYELSGFTLLPGQHIYIRWEFSDHSHVPPTDWDEIAIDDIQFVGNATTEYPGIAGTYQDLRIQGRSELIGTTHVVNYIHLLEIIELQNHNLSVDGQVLFGGGTFLRTNGTGRFTLNNLVGARTIPLGNSSYNPIIISNGNGLNWTFGLDDQVTNAQPPLDPTRAVQRTWHISPSVNPLPVPTNITFSYHDGDPSQIGSNFNPNEQVQVWHNNGFVWANVTPGITPTGTAGSTRTVTLNNWSTFSPFTIANVSAALPVKFHNVKAEKIGSRIKVSWSNLTESNVNKYIIERSADGRLFNSIGEKPATVNNGGRADYSSFDDMPLQGVNYYRIVALEIDGAKVLSSIVRIDPNNLQPQLTVYPTKVQRGAQVFISMSNLERGSYMIKLIGMSGQVLQRQLIQYNGGSVTLPVEVPGNLQQGVYILELLSAGQKFQQRLVVSE